MYLSKIKQINKDLVSPLLLYHFIFYLVIWAQCFEYIPNPTTCHHLHSFTTISWLGYYNGLITDLDSTFLILESVLSLAAGLHATLKCEQSP
jgi:hypothetical protein